VITVFGSINLDLIFRTEALPHPGQTVPAASMRTEPGGKGANQAAAAARDGARVAMVGAVGRDAQTALAGLRAAGADLSRLAVRDAPTGCASVCTDAEGRNQIVVALGANILATDTQVEDALLVPGGTLVTQMEADPARTARLLLRARARGARTIHNLAPAAPLADQALRALDILVVNEVEGMWLGTQLGGTDGSALSLHRILGITVIRTLGDEGVEWADGGQRHHRPAPPTQVRDTTAAGDCFVGVLAAALDRGATLAEAVTRGHRSVGHQMDALETAMRCLTPGVNGQYPRPWMTDIPHPEKARVFVVGYNQATGFPIKSDLHHDAFMDALYNRNGRSCRALYEMMRGEREPSRTHRNTCDLAGRLSSCSINDVLVTNVICYSTPMGKNLGSSEHREGRDLGRTIFSTLLAIVRPQVLITHGKGTARELARVLRIGSPPELPDRQRGAVSFTRVSAQLNGSCYSPTVFVLPSLAPPAWYRWASWAPDYMDRVCVRVRQVLGR
jgi:ribokinase